MAHHYLMVVLFIRYMRPKIQLCGTLLFLEQLMFYNYGMRYIIAAKLRKLKKGKRVIFTVLVEGWIHCYVLLLLAVS